jgi:uroporphyrinogen-III synthase
VSEETRISEQKTLATGLKNKRVVVTRAEHQAQELAQLLRIKGAEPVIYPCIRIIPPDNPRELDNALRRAARGDFDWLIITSANTVNILGQRLDSLNLSLDDIRVAVIGPRTAAAAERQLRIDIEIVPESFVAEGLVEALPPMRGKTVFLPQAALARPTLAIRLISAGAQVSAVEAYRTGIGQGGAPVPQMLADGQIDALIFSSASTVSNFLERLKHEGGHKDDMKEVCLAAIGPVTAKSMREMDLPVDVQPARYTLDELVNALADYYNASLTPTRKNNQTIYE